mmetsp:Transcript_91993/g.297622  ORF Transcript_91993/g.297622 Transcript_91993/m.297622 type:complete len:491 (+) Transcript_91993:70-1542(+)
MSVEAQEQQQFLVADDTLDMSSDCDAPRPSKWRGRLAAASAAAVLVATGTALVVLAVRRPTAGLSVGGGATTAAVVVLAELGPVTKLPWDCSADGADCRTTQCCSNPGSQCYVKNKYWAACNATCSTGQLRGDKDGQPWSCAALGERAPPACSWEGENCAVSKCCRRSGFQCFAKDDNWASCSDDCSKLSGSDPMGHPWTCKVLGRSQGAHYVQPVIEAVPLAATSLFCFTVVTPQGVVAPGVKPGYEQELVGMMKEQGVGIFSCDAAEVYEGVRVARGSWQSVVNTDIFVSIWQKVQADGIYSKHAWTVKVDADAVFLPDRLRTHLMSLRPPSATALYLQNIDFRFHFMGALEVLSSKAVDIFVASAHECAKHLGSNGGEDFFTMQCLDSMGVGHMTDYSLLDDKYTHGQGWNLYDVNPCSNPATVAFHPYKAVNSWQGCHKVALGAQKPEDFVGCQYRWEGDACSLTSIHQHSGTDAAKATDGIIFRK